MKLETAMESPGGHLPGREGILYEAPHTRVTRSPGTGGDGASVVRKQALGESAVARIRNEVAILRRLVGVDGVTRLVGVPDGERDVVLLEDVRGTSLADAMADGAAIPPLPQLALELAQTLAGIHRAGVIHRDINPANIMLAGGRPVLIDFDLATTFAEVRPAFTHHHEIPGRLPYLAPEQTGRTALAVDTRADLYGLGATLYEVATGRPPFGDDDDDVLNLLRAILGRRPEPLHVVNRTAGPGLSAVVERLLEKEPSRRYQSADGLVHDLRLVCQDPRRPLRTGLRDFPMRLLPPTDLVGREVELGVLRRALDDVVGGQARTVLVSGAPGAGKSALVGQLRHLVTARRGLFVAAKFEQFRPDATTGGLAHVLGSVCRLLLADADDVERKRLRTTLEPHARVLAAAVGEFGPLIGHAVPAGGPPERGAMCRAAVALLRAVASPSRPVVVVLDDLQWADPVAREFLDAVLTGGEPPGLLLVGAYRGEAVDATHPLAAIVSRTATTTLTLTLTNLAGADQVALVSTMLRMPPEEAAALACVLAERAAGNPYDTIELVNILRRDGLLRPGADGWHWDGAGIRRHVGGGDVVDLLGVRLSRLPRHTGDLLQVAACLGGEFRLDVLTTAAGCTPETAYDVLAPAFDDGLLVLDEHLGGEHPTVRFRHDRVQQAVRRLSGSDGDRVVLHREIARRLAAHPEHGSLAAEQYAAALSEEPGDRLDQPGERSRVAALFESAAAAATEVCEYETAERYLRLALGVDRGDDRARTRLRIARHTALYSLGRLDDADEVYREIESSCDDPLTLTDATGIQVSSLTNRARLAEAIALGAGVLARIGVAVPDSARMRDELRPRIADMAAWARGLSVAAEVARAEATDPRALAAGLLIGRMAAPAFFADPDLSNWLATEAWRFWLRHGPSEALAGPIAVFQLGGAEGLADYSTDVFLIRDMLAISEQRGYDVATPHVRFLFAVRSCPWIEPLEHSAEQARQARKRFISAGVLQTAGFTFTPDLTATTECGASLPVLAAVIEEAEAFAHRTGNTTVTTLTYAADQFVRALHGPGEPDETIPERYTGNRMSLLYAHYHHALAAALLGDWAALADHAGPAMELVTPMLRHYIGAPIRTVYALLQAHLIRTGAAPDEPAAFAALDSCHDWLARRAVSVPVNFGHLAHLVDAERAWAAGDLRAAMVAFDAALRGVDGRRPWHRALIHERAAEFYRHSGADGVSHLMLRQALEYYEAWGATVKVRGLRDAYPFLAAAPTTGGTDASRHRMVSSRIGVASDDIDLMALLRSSQAISSETNIERLHAAIVEHAQAITGATGVRLLLSDERHGWVVPALQPDERSVPLDEEADSLPVTVCRYVARTVQTLLLPDAVDDDRFSADPYLAGLDRCSLLVIPVVRQGATLAMLVLENRLTANAFRTDRLDAITLLAGQLAVSIGNAVLYRQLEERVRERTRALELANEQLAALSLTDPLTGLANRRSLTDSLTVAWHDGVSNGTPVGIVLIDIDYFKRYNDHYGHPAGDGCLQAVAAVLRTTCRDGTDLVCRYGGEEFAVVLPGADAASAGHVAERVCAALSAMAIPHAGSDRGRVTLSAGAAALVPTGANSPEELIKIADAALYQAKNLGRDRVCVDDGTDDGSDASSR